LAAAQSGLIPAAATTTGAFPLAQQVTIDDDDWLLAYQGIAGLRYAVSPNVDAGVKYRYFRTGTLGFDDAFAVNNVPFTTETSGHYSSHSVLASLAYNFNGRAAAAPEPEAPPPPPPAPEAPATQTCADGSVILATGTCPVPPPPPPPPAPATGERGR